MSISPDSLAARPTLDHETMWRYMRQLLDRLFGVLESEAVIWMTSSTSWSISSARTAGCSS